MHGSNHLPYKKNAIELPGKAEGKFVRWAASRNVVFSTFLEVGSLITITKFIEFIPSLLFFLSCSGFGSTNSIRLFAGFSSNYIFEYTFSGSSPGDGGDSGGSGVNSKSTTKSTTISSYSGKDPTVPRSTFLTLTEPNQI